MVCFVLKLANWRWAYWEAISGIVQNLTNLSYRGFANLKISIFLLNMFVCMLIELENHKILQAGCFWSWQIKEEGKLSSIDISGQLLSLTKLKKLRTCWALIKIWNILKMPICCKFWAKKGFRSKKGAGRICQLKTIYLPL